jgi:hypothetical protein
MGTTSNYALRYPAAGATNNVPSDIQNLATDVDTNLKSVHDTLLGDIPTLDSTNTDIASSAPGDTGLAGTSADAARADHRHPRETYATGLQGTADLTVYTEALTAYSTSGSTQAIDLSTAREFTVTLDANVTLSFTGAPTVTNKRLSFGLRLTQDSTGSRTVTWPASVKWGTAGAPTLTTTAGKSDFLGFVSDDSGTTWLGFVGGMGF